MLIAAHAGVGKTYFCNNVHNSKDFVCMPYKYFLPENTKNEIEFEKMKADFSLERDPEYPGNYVKAILENAHKYEYFIIPSASEVLSVLASHNVPYILCYPTIDAKDEYKDRYIRRGNTDDFMSVFIGCWDFFMHSLRSDSYGIHIELSEDEYLLDVKERIDKIIQEEQSQETKCGNLLGE